MNDHERTQNAVTRLDPGTERWHGPGIAGEERARRNHQSLEGEVREILAEAAQAVPEVPTEGRRLRVHRVSFGGATTWSCDALYDDSSPNELGSR